MSAPVTNVLTSVAINVQATTLRFDRHALDEITKKVIQLSSLGVEYNVILHGAKRYSYLEVSKDLLTIGNRTVRSNGVSLDYAMSRNILDNIVLKARLHGGSSTRVTPLVMPWPYQRKLDLS